jgi:serine/threonine protein kinase
MAASLIWADLEIQERLGEGQAGEVWRARVRRRFRDLSAGDTVAVKRYKRWVMDQPGQHERIYRELALGMKVQHPNIAHAYCLVNSPDDRPSLVMRYYEGRTLDALLRQQRETDTDLWGVGAFQLLRGIAEGVHALHQAGALHRDLKPANIIVGPDGTPVVMDLGVVTETVLPEHTRTEQFLGTIRYADPEYLTGIRCSIETDIYSIGAVAHEVFFRQRFMGDEENWANLVARIVGRQSPSAREIARCCKRVQSEHGRNVAEAVYWTVRNLLKTRHPSVLQHFVSAVRRKFWEQPFCHSEDGIIMGIPDSLPASASAPSKNVRSLSALARQLHSLLSPNVIERIRNTIDERYWEWRCDLDEHGHITDVHNAFESLHVFRDFTMGIGEKQTEITSALLMLHRYGLLHTDAVA